MRETMGVVAIFAFVGAGLVASERLDGGSPAGALVGWTAVVGGVVLAHYSLRRVGRSLTSLGLAPPRSWLRVAALSAAAAIAILALGSWLLAALIVPLVDGRPPDTSRFDALKGNPVGLTLALGATWTAAAFGEEILVRGYMMDHFARRLGGGSGSWLAAAALSSAIFGAMHFYQGAAGVAITGVVGFLLAAAYLLTGRNLWVAIGAHGLIDTVSLVSVYLAGR